MDRQRGGLAGVAFKRAQAFGTGNLGWTVVSLIPQPDPIGPTPVKPSFSRSRHRAVVGVLHCELEQNLVARPAIVAASEDVVTFSPERVPHQYSLGHRLSFGRPEFYHRCGARI